MDNTQKTIEELKDDLEKKILFYESQLSGTIDQVQRGVLVGKIDRAKKEIKDLTAKKPVPVKLKTRIEDPTLGEKKKNSSTPYDGRGSVVNTGTGFYSFTI